MNITITSTRALAAAVALLLLAGYRDGEGGSFAAPPDVAPTPTPAAAFGVAALRATTTYILGNTLGQPGLVAYLQANLPAIKATGFNAVYLQALWMDFDPSPLASPRVYSTTAFANAAAALDTIRAAGMAAVIGLNYIGVGYAPDLSPALMPARACDWQVNETTYAAFEQYAAAFLTQLAGYGDIAKVILFTENAEGCDRATLAAAPAVAARLQTTLGSLPSRLPARTRAKWQIGYHDYSLVNLGWAHGAGPIASPNPFDFVSMVAYNVTTTAELDERAARFLALYPRVPLIVGEAGTAGCPAPATEQSQAAGDTMLVSWAVSHGYGFNLWGWPNAGDAECSNPVYGGLALTKPDGSPRRAIIQLQPLLTATSAAQ